MLTKYAKSVTNKQTFIEFDFLSLVITVYQSLLVNLSHPIITIFPIFKGRGQIISTKVETKFLLFVSRAKDLVPS